VFLIWDSLRVHHSKPVKARALANVQMIELLCLPRYSPEFNPQDQRSG